MFRTLIFLCISIICSCDYTVQTQVLLYSSVEFGQYSVMMKGAPEIVFDRCSTILISGKEVTIDDKIKKEFQKACENLGSRGERVMGFCHLDLDNRKFPKNFKFKAGGDANFPVEGLRY